MKSLLTFLLFFLFTFSVSAQSFEKRNAFDPASLIRPYTNALRVYTDDFRGDDLGAKIMAADAVCGKRLCVIEVGQGDFLSPSFTSEYRLLYVKNGIRKSRVPIFQPSGTPNYGRILYPASNTIILGQSWSAILEEQNSLANAPPSHSLIAPRNLLVIPEGESTSNITKSRNIHAIGLHFVGANNPANDVGLSTVAIGNDDFSSVQDCWFEKTSGYGVSVGGTPGEYVVGGILPDGRTVGFHARNVAILRNVFDGVLTQNLGLITFDRLLVADNKFINIGKRNPDGSYSPFLTIIDLEPNGNPREIIRGLVLIRNFIDARNSNGSQYFGGMAFQITDPQIFNEKNLIADNTILGSENGLTQMVFGLYVNGAGTNDLTLRNNYIQTVFGTGLILEGTKIRSINNILFNTGGGGSPAMLVEFLSDSFIESTVISHDRANHNAEIYEKFTNSNNRFDSNDVNAIYHVGTTADSIYKENSTNAGIIENPFSVRNLFINNKFK